jgi:hypothetical protein
VIPQLSDCYCSVKDIMNYYPASPEVLDPVVVNLSSREALSFAALDRLLGRMTKSITAKNTGAKITAAPTRDPTAIPAFDFCPVEWCSKNEQCL